jgi:osmotically-inducible protein OsmY
MRNKHYILCAVVLFSLTLFFAACASSPHRESTGEYIDDSVITTKVKAVLAKDDFLKSFKISVETYKGIVQLSGFVDSQSTVNKAEKIAGSVTGVKSVKNSLVIK